MDTTKISETRKAVLPMFDAFIDRFISVIGKSDIHIHKPERIKVDNFPDVQEVSVKSFPQVQKVSGEVTVKNQIKLPQVQKVDGSVTVKNQIKLPEVQKVEGEISVSQFELLLTKIDSLIESINKMPQLPAKVPVEITNWQFAMSDGGGLPLDDAYWLRENFTYETIANEVVPVRVERYSSTVKETEDIRYDDSANPIARNKYRESVNGQV